MRRGLADAAVRVPGIALPAARPGLVDRPRRRRRHRRRRACFAPLLAPHSPYAQEAERRRAEPVATWMGLDSANRDIFSRLLYGARWSLVIGLGATAIALVVGALIGAVAATSPHGPSTRRSCACLDVVMAFPGIALAAVLVAVFGKQHPGPRAGDRVPLHAVGGPHRPRERAGPVRRGLRRGRTRHRRPHARTSCCGTSCVNCAAPVLVFVHGHGGRRDRLRGVACRSSARAYAPPDAPRGAASSPTAGTWCCSAAGGRPFFPGLLILHHRARAEHPRRGHVRRLGRTGRAPRASTVDRGRRRAGARRSPAPVRSSS